jgi:hypothetical protein
VPINTGTGSSPILYIIQECNEPETKVTQHLVNKIIMQAVSAIPIPKIIFFREAGGVGAMGLRGGEEEEEAEQNCPTPSDIRPMCRLL